MPFAKNVEYPRDYLFERRKKKLKEEKKEKVFCNFMEKIKIVRERKIVVNIFHLFVQFTSKLFNLLKYRRNYL